MKTNRGPLTKLRLINLQRRALNTALLMLFLVMQLQGHAQKAILIGFYAGPYYDGTAFNNTATHGVPCPLDPYSYPKTSTWFYDHLAQKANDFAKSGFTAIWLPPMSKGSLGFRGPADHPEYIAGGIYDTGYGVFDHYDLGDKLQSGHYQTRYGSRNQLNRCIAMLRANGMEAYEDFVLNQVGITPNVTPGYSTSI